MKRKLLGAAVLVWMLSSAVVAEPQQTNGKEPAAMAQIRVQIAETDRQEKTYRKVEREVVGESTEGGDVVGQFKGNELRKVTVRYFGETGKLSCEYYLRNDRVYFGVRNDSTYTEPLSGKIAHATQTRFYWDRTGKLVRVLESGKVLEVSNPKTVTTAREFTDGLTKLKALLNAPKTKS